MAKLQVEDLEVGDRVTHASAGDGTVKRKELNSVTVVYDMLDDDGIPYTSRYEGEWLAEYDFLKKKEGF